MEIAFQTKVYAVRLAVIWLTLNTVAAQQPCQTFPDATAGVCIILNECAYHFERLKNLTNTANTPITSEIRSELFKNQCGYIAGKVYICCPADTLNDVKITAGFSRNVALSTTETCGTVGNNSLRNVGTVETHIEEYPWLALVEYTSADNEKAHYCGGVLISDRHVLTAAHCATGAVLRDNWRLTGVRLGEWNTTSNPDCEDMPSRGRVCAPNYQDIASAHVYIHPQYTHMNRAQQYDIAMILLQKAAILSAYVKPICLPNSPASSKNDSYASLTMEVGGWQDSSRTLQKSLVRVWKSTNCAETYEQHNINLQMSQLCGEPIGNEADRCRGNSGGPLMHYANGVYSLVGILSFGPQQCASQGWPDVYTNVGSYIGWINDIKNV